MGFERDNYSVGEDQSYYELPFKIQGVLENPVTLKVSSTDGTAVRGVDFEFVGGGTDISLSRGDEWNFIGFAIKDDVTSIEDKVFNVSLESIDPANPLINISAADKSCTVTIKNVERRLRVTDTLVEIPEYIGKMNYDFNLTAIVPATVKATIEVDTDKSTAIEGKHFTIANKSIEIAPGETDFGVEIKIIDDILGHDNRKIFLKITNAEGVEVSDVYGVGEIVIENDDNTIGFQFSSLPVVGGGPEFQIPITVNGVRNETVQCIFEVTSVTAVQGVDFSVAAPIKPIVNAEELVTYLKINTIQTAVTKVFKLKLIDIKGTNGEIQMNTTIDPNRAECEVSITGTIDKTKWVMIDGSVGATAEQGPEKIIDGTYGDEESSKWHSLYTDPTCAAPWHFIIDMQETVFISSIKLNARAGQQDSPHVAVYISDEVLAKDSPDWVEMLDYRFPTNPYAPVQTLPIPGSHKGRYMMLKILEGRGGSNVSAFTEITVNPAD